MVLATGEGEEGMGVELQGLRRYSLVVAYESMVMDVVCRPHIQMARPNTLCGH